MCVYSAETTGIFLLVVLLKWVFLDKLVGHYCLGRLVERNLLMRADAGVLF